MASSINFQKTRAHLTKNAYTSNKKIMNLDVGVHFPFLSRLRFNLDAINPHRQKNYKNNKMYGDLNLKVY